MNLNICVSVGRRVVCCAFTPLLALPGDRQQWLSGPQASVAFCLPAGTPPFVQMRDFPTYTNFHTATTNLGKTLGLTVMIGPGKVDWSEGVAAAIEQSLATMREVYENPQMRWLDSAKVLGQSVPIFETRDGTGDDELHGTIPVRKGLVSVTLTAQGDENVAQHAAFFRDLLQGATVRER